jgi:2-polyprenyl-6-methoxyphenol hydroxylase-like FAD-dependent oxidoreductase
VEYVFEGERHRVRGRLVAGADGRGSQVARRVGIELERDPTHHLFSGMLVEGAHGWPEDLQVTGSEKDVHYLAFPQGNGRVRLYLGYSCDQPRRLAGAGGPAAFLEAFRLESVPGSEHLSGAEPAGPCHSYPNEDTWTDVLHRDGVFLVGDAAGSNDPIIGQGLSITMRDVRLVRDALLGEKDWERGGLFAEYAAERRERMRRLRFSASLMSILQNEFGEEAVARRHRALERQMRDPMLLFPFIATFIGPETPPAEAFEPSIRERLFD